MVVFVLLGFFYAYFTPGNYWDIYGYVVIMHILFAPFWTFELCMMVVVYATMNKIKKGIDLLQDKDQEDVSSANFSTKL